MAAPGRQKGIDRTHELRDEGRARARVSAPCSGQQTRRKLVPFQRHCHAKPPTEHGWLHQELRRSAETSKVGAARWGRGGREACNSPGVRLSPASAS